MRPALDAPHMSAPKLITGNATHRATVRHNAHTTAARHARRHLAATNTPNKTVFRFPHHATRIHMLKPHAPRLTHQSTISHMRKQHVTGILHHTQSLHIHIITKRAPTNGNTPVIPKPLGPNQATHETRRRTRISRRTHNQRAIRRTHRPHARARIIPLDRATITNHAGNSATRSGRTSEPATLRGLLLSEESLTLRQRPEMRCQLTIGTHKPAPARLRTTPRHAASSLTPNANMKTSHNQPHSPHHKEKTSTRPHADTRTKTGKEHPRQAPLTHENSNPTARHNNTPARSRRAHQKETRGNTPTQTTNKHRRPHTTGHA